MSRISPVPSTKTGPLLRLAYWYSTRRFGTMPEPFAVMAHSKPVFIATARLELAAERRWKAIDKHLMELAVLKAALTIDCPWCVDFGSMLGAATGVDPAKIEQLTRWRESDLYSDVERAALEYAEAMSVTPLQVTDEMVERLRLHLSERQVVELTAYIALENSRARTNTALGIESQHYSADAWAGPQPT
jgi:AhpD family alkylhydroperoxidase